MNWDHAVEVLLPLVSLPSLTPPLSLSDSVWWEELQCFEWPEAGCSNLTVSGREGVCGPAHSELSSAGALNSAGWVDFPGRGVSQCVSVCVCLCVFHLKDPVFRSEGSFSVSRLRVSQCECEYTALTDITHSCSLTGPHESFMWARCSSGYLFEMMPG